MNKKTIAMICLLLVCRVFVINFNWKGGILDKSDEITMWLQDKTIVSVTQSGTSGYGSTERAIITIIAEDSHGQ